MTAKPARLGESKKSQDHRHSVGKKGAHIVLLCLVAVDH